MWKVVHTPTVTVVVLENGTCLQKVLSSQERLALINCKTESEVVSLFLPSHQEQDVYINTKDISSSKLLTRKGDSVYWEEVSQLSVPTELCVKIIKAELNNDEVLIETYRNFWTLMSLNPDERCRKNLFWFLSAHNFKLARCGFFVAYRNVDTTKEKDVFTDHHSHTFRIKIGEMVTMPRSCCDSVQENMCSRGLHLANEDWLDQNYYGNVGLVCLCNPADVVAVPFDATYGKLRTCAYLPIDFIKYDSNGKVIPYDVESGFDNEYIPQIIYEGLQGEEENAYTIVTKNIIGVNKTVIDSALLDMARECIVRRNEQFEL